MRYSLHQACERHRGKHERVVGELPEMVSEGRSNAVNPPCLEAGRAEVASPRDRAGSRGRKG